MMRALKFDKGMGRRGQQSHRKRRSMTGSYRSLCVYKGCGAATYVDDVGFGQARSEINPSARFFSKDVPSLRFSSRFMPFPRERTGDFQKLRAYPRSNWNWKQLNPNWKYCGGRMACASKRRPERSSRGAIRRRRGQDWGRPLPLERALKDRCRRMFIRKRCNRCGPGTSLRWRWSSQEDW